MPRRSHWLGRSVVGVALVAAMVASGLALTGSPAAAHTKLSPFPSCSGGEIGHYHTHSSRISVFVSFSSASGGTNCVWAQKQTNRGTPESMNLRLFRCSTGSPGSACNATAVDQDPGSWSFFAGPVQLTNTAGRCIVVHVVYQGSTAVIGPVHCG